MSPNFSDEENVVMLQANCSGRSYPNAYSDTRLASLDPIQTSCLVLTKSTS